jgi:ketosteroid isomerase-like protein
MTRLSGSLAVFNWTHSYFEHLLRQYSVEPVVNISVNSEGIDMDNKVKWGLVGLVLLGSATLAQAQQTGTTEKTIAALEEKWTQSQKTNNPDLISAHWSDKLVSTGTDGTVSNRAQTLANAKATKYTSIDISDLHVTVVEGTAIASMVFDAKGTDEKGKPMDMHARWTDVWVKMPHGTWQCVASHGSNIKT